MNERQRSSAGLHDDLLGGLLGGLRSELDQDVQALRDLRSVQSRAGRIDVLSADLDQQLERVERAAVLTLVGATGAGKSTLLNALVGRDVAHEGDSRPTTRVPVIHRPADADIRELLDGLPGEAPKVVDHDPGGGGPWSQQILVDAPDTNSVEASHREVVAALAERSDVLVVVAHRQSVAELSSATFVDDFAKRRALVFVLGRADELSDADRGALLEQLRTLVRERWNAPDAPILAVSPRDAQRNPSSPGWQELVSTLRGLAEDGALGRVRRHNALGTAAELSRVFADVDHEIGVTLDELVTFIASGVESWRAGLLQEVAVRLDLKRPDVTALVQSEAAKRWEGPGGWALRTGGLTTMGLSAGALLARRNPLLAAGAAAGAMAADRARGAIRNAGIADPTGLLPSHAGMTALYHQSFGPARMVASDLANDGAESLAVPLEDGDGHGRGRLGDSRHARPSRASRESGLAVPALGRGCAGARTGCLGRRGGGSRTLDGTARRLGSVAQHSGGRNGLVVPDADGRALVAGPPCTPCAGPRSGSVGGATRGRDCATRAGCGPGVGCAARRGRAPHRPRRTVATPGARVLTGASPSHPLALPAPRTGTVRGNTHPSQGWTGRASKREDELWLPPHVLARTDPRSVPYGSVQAVRALPAVRRGA